MHVIVLARHHRHEIPPFAEYLRSAGVAHTVLIDRSPLDWRLLGRLRRELRSLAPDIIQTHGYKATALGFALRSATPSMVPWIAFYHGATNKGVKDRVYQALEDRLLARADRVVVVSEPQRLRFAHLPRVRVIPNAVVPAIGAGRVPVRPIAMSDRPRIGVVARLSREKGVDVFLRACGLLREADFRFSAVVAGDGPEAASLRRLARECGVEGAIQFLGHVEEVDTLYPLLDLMVLPSRSEGLPNVLLEALAADLTVVATAVGAVPEVLSTPGSGYVVPPDDARQLAEAIRLAAAEGSSGRARAEVVNRYSLERRTSLHAGLYEELLGTNAAARADHTLLAVGPDTGREVSLRAQS